MNRWVLIAALLLASPARGQPKPRVLRVGVIVPEGSSWMREAHALANEVIQKSNGRLAIRLLPNAAAGEEREMVARVRDGQLDGCGISVVGARVIAPELSVFLLPRLVRTYAEYDELWNQLRPLINERLSAHGFVMLARVEGGYEHVWSKRQPIRSLADLRKQKLWLWDDDAVTSEFASFLHLPVQRMGLYEALPALRSGRIEGLFRFPPLAVLAFQLHSEIKWALEWKFSFLSGGIFVSKKVMDSLSEDDQRLLRTTSQKFETRLIRLMREDNERAVDLLKKQGIKFVPPDAKAAEELDAALARARKELGPRLVGAIAYPELEASVEARRRKEPAR